MKPFMDQDFMLTNEIGKTLYHQYAEKVPIIDYHCHLSAREIYENVPAKNLTELWLAGDHYKWRAMRGNGIPEERITGSADDYDKFLAFAETLPFAIVIRCTIGHTWSCSVTLELMKRFLRKQLRLSGRK